MLAGRSSLARPRPLRARSLCLSAARGSRRLNLSSSDSVPTELSACEPARRLRLAPLTRPAVGLDSHPPASQPPRGVLSPTQLRMHRPRAPPHGRETSFYLISLPNPLMENISDPILAHHAQVLKMVRDSLFPQPLIGIMRQRSPTADRPSPDRWIRSAAPARNPMKLQTYGRFCGFWYLPTRYTSDILSTSHPSHRSFLTEVTCIKDGFFFCAHRLPPGEVVA